MTIVAHPRRFGSAKHVQGITHLPLSSIYDYTRRGLIPGVARVGRRLVFDLDKLEAWIDAGGDLGQQP